MAKQEGHPSLPRSQGRGIGLHEKSTFHQRVLRKLHHAVLHWSASEDERKMGLRLGLFSDFHFSDDFIVAVNPGLDVMNANLGLSYHF